MLRLQILSPMLASNPALEILSLAAGMTASLLIHIPSSPALQVRLYALTAAQVYVHGIEIFLFYIILLPFPHFTFLAPIQETTVVPTAHYLYAFLSTLRSFIYSFLLHPLSTHISNCRTGIMRLESRRPSGHGPIPSRRN